MSRFLFMDLMEGRLSLELTAIQVACHAARHLLLQSSNNPWFPPEVPCCRYLPWLPLGEVSWLPELSGGQAGVRNRHRKPLR